MYRKIILLGLIFTAIAIFYHFEWYQYLSLSSLKEQQLWLIDHYHTNTVVVLGIFFAVYILVTALSLPGAAVMTIAAGAIFGFQVGVLTVSFASSIGATLAFLIAKYFLHDFVQKKYGHKLKNINDGIAKQGGYYLFALRLVPIMPFFLLNILMGLTSIRTSVYYITSQLGMLPGTILYVFVGTAIGSITEISDVMSWEIILAFSLLGIFPLIIKRIVNISKSYFQMRHYKKPKKFDYNIAVVGGGSAGLIAAYMASQLKAKVALIEKDKMGGDCLNTGCVPSKAFIKSAKLVNLQHSSSEYGLESLDVEFTFKGIMQRVRRVIREIEPHDSVERYTKLGVECLQGEAKILDPYRIKIKDEIITTKKIVIASGASPFVPPIAGLKDIAYLTSDNIWQLNELPKSMVVLGGGPIGVELSQAFARLGAKVTIIEMQDKLLIREDFEVSETIQDTLVKEGVTVLTKYAAQEVIVQNSQKILRCQHHGDIVDIEFDSILVALGRRANISGFGLEDLPLSYTKMGTLEVNECLQTSIPNIYACGDVVGPYQFTHTAGYQGMLCSLNALFGRLKTFKTDYRVIPWTTFTDPEIARVGINEQEAKEANIEYEVTIYQLSELDRAITEGDTKGMLKVITKTGSDSILGVTIVGANASDLLAEFVLAMQHNLGLEKILKTMHAYPTMSEANKAIAGVWKKSHTNPRILAYLEKFFTWLR